MKRFVAAGIALSIAFGAVIWFLLLASTSANTALFASHYTLLLVLSGLLAVVLLGLVGWQLRSLWRDYRAKVFGARLKLRLMIKFGLIAVIPGLLVYGVSVQFVTRSIESRFDVRIEKALESGLNLGRYSLDWSFFRLSSLSPREQIRFFYLAAVRRASEKGVPRQPAETPLEFAEDMKESWPEAEQDIDHLTDAFLDARYSPQPISKEDVNPVKRTWQQVKSSLRRKTN